MANTPSGSHSLLSVLVCDALAAIASACSAYWSAGRDRLVAIIDLVVLVVDVFAVSVGGRFARIRNQSSHPMRPRSPSGRAE